jgi:hypothetical protein
MTDLKAELDALNEHIKALEAQRADIYQQSLALPDEQKVCKDWIAESLSEVPNEMKFPITVHGIAWEGELWEKGPTLGRIEPGDLASVRPADADARTYLGVYLGAQCVHDSASLDPATGILRFRKFGGNPTFWIPTLKRVVYGMGSWWAKIDSPEKLKAITDADIAAVPYVQIMKAMLEAPGAAKTEELKKGHLIGGEFQSDKYPTTPRGKVPLSVKDVTAQDLLWEYAYRRRSVDAEFSADLEEALRLAGFVPREAGFLEQAVASGLAIAERDGRAAGIAEALEAGYAVVRAGFLKNPFPSMPPTEVKQTRDDMTAGAHKVFDAIRALDK